MPVTTVAAFLAELRASQILDAESLRQADALAGTSADPKAAALVLVRRGLLTSYQANKLLHGHGRDLLLGEYVLLDFLGEGGMGRVFKARHQLMKRLVALKVLRPDRVSGPDAVRRFRREIEAIARLSHPHIVLAYDAKQTGDTTFLVTEFVEGADLSRVLKQRGPLPVAQACEYARQAALGLQHAHEHGLVHRDVKPSNLLLVTATGQVKLLDLGLARLSGTPVAADEDSGLTREGAVMGTPDYIAPEQIRDPRQTDVRADLYSLGCTLYHLLTGRVPFPHGTAVEKLAAHLDREPQAVETLRPEVPPRLAALVRKLMAKRREARYQTPAEAATALAAFAGSEEKSSGQASTVPLAPTLDEPPPGPTASWNGRPARRWPLWAGLGGLAVLAAGLAFALLPRQPQPGPDVDEPKTFANSLGMNFVRVGPFHFIRGSTPNYVAQVARRSGLDFADESPAHEVELDPAFYMATHEVTQGQYQRVMGRNPSHFLDGAAGEDPNTLPVEKVTWFEAVEFCRLLSETPDEKQAGRVYRLPTEAEWEAVARSEGPAALDEQAWSAANAEGRTHPVGTLQPNRMGLYDLLGNVAEWCLDWYGPYHDPSRTTAPDTGLSRVVRGGDWASVGVACRPSSRGAQIPTERHARIGFRVVMDGGRLPSPPDRPPAEPDLDDRAIPWNKDIKDLLTSLLPEGLKNNTGRSLYDGINASMDRGEEAAWTVGKGLTKDGNPYLIELKADRLTAGVLSADKVAELKVEDHVVSYFKTKTRPLPLHGGQPVSWREPRVWLQTDPDGTLFLVGRARCEAPAGRAYPARDVALRLEREFRNGTESITVVKFEFPGSTRTPAGWLTFRVKLPTSEQAAGKGSKPSDWTPGDRLVLKLDAFVLYPRPGMYQVSDELHLRLVSDGRGLTVRPDPDYDGPWNRKSLGIVERTVRGKMDDSTGRRLYDGLTGVLEGRGQGQWVVGWDFTPDGRAHWVYSKDGEPSTRSLSREEAARTDSPLGGKIRPNTFMGSFGRPRVQEMVTLQEAQVRLEPGTDGKRKFVGRVKCLKTGDQKIEDLTIALHYKDRKPKPTPTEYRGSQTFQTLKEIPNGWLPLEFTASGSDEIDDRCSLLLTGYFTWPRAGYYQVSSELRFVLERSKGS